MEKSIKKCLFLLGLIGLPLFATSTDYQFYGKHFLVSYCDCDQEALRDTAQLSKVMSQAAEASGATILKTSEYVFSPDGLTMVILLSESHASIHTYPEHGACFVDLFTCGDRCSHEKFDAVLRDYLKPGNVDGRLLIRNQGIEETHGISR
jgi:S-adenosylmethionine decarboxylase